MENETGKLTGYCPLFDHDHRFAPYENVISQTTKEPITQVTKPRTGHKQMVSGIG